MAMSKIPSLHEVDFFFQRDQFFTDLMISIDHGCNNQNGAATLLAQAQQQGLRIKPFFYKRNSVS